MNDFKEKYRFDPNTAAKEILNEHFLEFANLIKGTPNETFIAYKDPKVQELVNLIISAIIFENERINAPETFPIEIYSRYKADLSMKNKMEDYASREDKKGAKVTDYLGIRIVPEAEHTIFFSDGDTVLQEMINKREKIRTFITDISTEISQKPYMTFDYYSKKCQEVLEKLIDVFPEEAINRKKYYQEMINTIQMDYLEYIDTMEDSQAPLPLYKIKQLTNINIRTLLTELTLNNPNEVILYKLRDNLMNTFQKSDLLHSLGITVSLDPKRTKRKATDIGYRSEFIGLDLNIRLSDDNIITLPIECQIQSAEQHRDGNIGFAAHTKLKGKNHKLKNIPSTGNYTDPNEMLKAYREFLAHLMYISPLCSITRTTGNDFENKRTITTTYDLYETFRTISRVPKNSLSEKTLSQYLETLYQNREKLMPTDASLLPKYVKFEEIPNPVTNFDKYMEFQNELSSSLKKTFDKAYGNSEKTSNISINESENYHDEH